MTNKDEALKALNKLAMACDPCNETKDLVRTIRAALAEAPKVDTEGMKQEIIAMHGGVF